jgi:flagellar motor component MotA
LEVVVEGVLAIQSGTSPRVVEKRLRAVLSAEPGSSPAQPAEAA